MGRIYRTFIKTIFSKASNGTSGECTMCRVPFTATETMWSVTINRQDGWVSRVTSIHPECGERMEYRGTFDTEYRPASEVRVRDERKAVRA